MTVDLKLHDGVAFATIDDGKVNAMTFELLSSISEALAKARSQNAVVVLTGRSGIFSAGFDMKTFERGEAATRSMVAAGVQAILDLLHYPRPVIARCDGHAFPMGAFLLLAADVRIGRTGTYKIGLNETAIAIDVPDFALALARFRLTPSAFAAIRTARMFSPEEAVLAGYLDHAEPECRLAASLDAEIDSALRLDVTAFRSTKARSNAAVISAIQAAGLPDRLLTA